MTGRLFRFVIALVAVPILCSCSNYEKVKTTGSTAPLNSNVAEPASRPVADTWSSASLDEWITGMNWIKERKEMSRAWRNFERSQKYRLAQPGETKSRPYFIWWGAEAYQGDEYLIAIVVDPSRTDPNRYGAVVVAAPESQGGKYRAYWVTREENMEHCDISVASGSLFVSCKREDGTEEVRSLGWYRSRRGFRLKTLSVRGTTGSDSAKN